MSHKKKTESVLLLFIAYAGFVSLGLPDTMMGIAWPSVRDTFKLPQSALGLVSITFGCGYFISSFFVGRLLRVLGTGGLLVASSVLVAVAMFGNAATPAWFFFIVCGAVWGLGSGAIDAGLNSYASQHFSARHVNWLHACYSLGATIGPLLMTVVLVRLGSWRLGYSAVGSIILLLTLCFLATIRLWNDSETIHVTENRIGVLDALKHPLVQLQAIIFFFYTGLEVLVGYWCFTLLTESRQIHVDHAGMIASGYFASIGIGRVLLGGLTDRIGIDWLLRYSLIAAVAGSLLYCFGTWKIASVIGLLIFGLGMAPIFPCLMFRTPQRIGAQLSVHAVGFQVSAATLGAATIPACAGLLAEEFGLETVARMSVLLVVALFGLHEVLLRKSHSLQKTR